jgi:hypothetical protein
MNCHNTTMGATDFLWSLKDHAFPSNVPNLLLADPQFKNLQSLLRATPHTAATAAQQNAIELRKKSPVKKKTQGNPSK